MLLEQGERMLTRIQIRADGDTAHNVETQLVDAMDAITSALHLIPVMREWEQVIEGTPNKGFRGRLSFTLAKAAVEAVR